MNPAAKHERANAEWHTDGPSRADDTCVLSWMTCHAAPTGMPGGVLPRWTTDDGEEVQQRFPAGATLFASSTAAYELAPQNVKAAIDEAVQFCGRFRLTSTTFMNLGCDIAEFSAFPHEKEFLYPSLTFLRPNGKTHKLVHDGTTFTVVEGEPSFPS